MVEFKSPCPVCLDLFGIVSHTHKASFCRYKVTKLACNYCAGPHKVTECKLLAQEKKGLFCDRCKRNNHTTNDCRARACPTCQSFSFDHKWNSCEQKKKDDNIDERRSAPDARWSRDATWEPDARWSRDATWEPNARWPRDATWEPNARWPRDARWEPDARWPRDATWEPDARWEPDAGWEGERGMGRDSDLDLRVSAQQRSERGCEESRDTKEAHLRAPKRTKSYGQYFGR
jgi:hypothetical protein